MPAPKLPRLIKDSHVWQSAIDRGFVVSLTDAAGIIRYVNPAFCTLAGLSDKALLGHDHRILSSGYHPKGFMRSLWHTLQQGNVWRGELKNQRPDGTSYWLDATIVPFVGKGGAAQYLLFGTDATARHMAHGEAISQAVQQRITAMGALLLHELKNPLAGLGTGLDIIAARLAPGPGERALFGPLLAGLGRVNALLDEIAAFAHPPALSCADTDVAAIFDGLAQAAHNEPELGRWVVQPHAPCRIWADGHALRNAFAKIIANGNQAAGAQAPVQVRIGATSGRCTITFTDRGPGIPPPALAQIFEPFFSTKRKRLGLGLAIAKRIIEQHGGNIGIVCPTGGGTEVRVVLRTEHLPHVAAAHAPAIAL